MIELRKIAKPFKEINLFPVILSESTLKQRYKNVVDKMKQKNYDAMIIYADLEHGSNFEYLTGFLPRFEEALLIVFSEGQAELVLGNENLNKASKARIDAKAIHMPVFSLPNQPMYDCKSIDLCLNTSRIKRAKRIGITGWKLFSSELKNQEDCYDLPYFVIDAIKKVCPHAELKNSTGLFIGENGVRVTNNEEELAHYEFGAALAGRCMQDAMDNISLGKNEMEIAEHLSALGQKHNVVTIMSTGERFEKANLYPGRKMIKKGDRISITTGYKGGLQSRCGYAVCGKDELPEKEKTYVETVVIPYFQAVKTWIEQIHIGMTGGELYEVIDNVFPKEIYGWNLNPGHLCADEEWLCSPIYKDSKEIIQSGMIFQIDIIPSVAGYQGASCESGVALADEDLRNKIRKHFPEMWERVCKRKTYMKNELGICVPEEVMPMSSMTAYYRPYLLNKDMALCSR